MNRNQSTSLRRLTLAWLGLTISAFLIVMGLRVSGNLKVLEFKFYDAFLMEQAMKSETDSRIVVVGITENDFHRWGWPLTDARLTQLLEILISAKPGVIGIDLYRDRPIPWNPDQTEFPDFVKLNQLLTAHSNIIGVMKFQEISPAPGFLESNRFGFSDLLPDSDGTIRRSLLFLNDEQGQVYYSFPLSLALKYLSETGVGMQPDKTNPEHLRLGKTTLAPLTANDGAYVSADDGGYQFLLDYYGLPNPFATLTLTDVLNGHSRDVIFEDRIVIICVTAKSEKDFFYTPNNNYLKSAQPISGGDLHGYTVSQLLRTALNGDRALSSLSEPSEWLWIWIWCALGGLIVFWETSFLRLAVIVIGGLSLIVFISYFAFTKRLWLPIFPTALGWMVCAAAVTSYRSSQEWIQRRLLMRMFSCYVPETIAQDLWRKREVFLVGGKPQPQRLIATVLFSDLQGFTSVSESLTPEALMDWLNTYMENMAEIVTRHSGIIDKFIGDAVMAVFGVPNQRTEHSEMQADAQNAVRCAFAMGEKLDLLNKQWTDKGLPTVKIRVGISTGSLVAGSMGSRNRLEYTVIGDTVNIASRLESFDKNYFKDDKCRILISQRTLKYLNQKFPTEGVGEVALKGKLKKIEIFRVLAK